jgi:peptidoglycan/LPS O-acetylase OafA/YrhL
VHGHFGVQLFFTISGFVILMTLERSRSLADFAVSRFARLYPAYLACASVTLVVIAFGHLNPDWINLKRAVVNLTMVAPLLGRPAIDPSYWTLTYEILFYVAAGVTFLGFGLRRVEGPCLAWLAVAVAGRLAGYDTRSMTVAMVLDTDFANLFVAGMMVYRLVAGGASALTWMTLAAALGMAWLGPDYKGGNSRCPASSPWRARSSPWSGRAPRAGCASWSGRRCCSSATSPTRSTSCTRSWASGSSCTWNAQG